MRRLSREFTVWDGDRLVTAGFTPNRVPGNISKEKLEAIT